MNARLSKKVRQAMRRNWREFYKDITSLPFGIRLRIAWFIVTHSEKEIKRARSKGRAYGRQSFN